MTTPATSNSELALLPPILTASALAIAGGLAAFYPIAMVMLYVGILPVALILLWVGRDVPAPLDRIAAVDAERRAKQAARVEARKLPRAA